jgi:hypothetical protein
MTSLLTVSRLAGVGYLVIFVTGIFANFFVLEHLVVPGDPDGTATAIIGNGMLFRAGIAAFVVMVIFDLFLTWALYLLLEPAHRTLSLLAAWFRLVNVALFAVALVQLPGALRLLESGGTLAALDPVQARTSAMLSLESFNDGWLVGLLFFGGHLLILGWLIFRCGYMPRLVGVLLAVAGLGYLVDSLANFLLPTYAGYASVFMLVVVVPGVVGELSLALWLLFRGVRDTATALPRVNSDIR